MFADERTTTVDLIRHGEPVGGRRFRGSQDDPLSELGWEQMRGAVASAQPWSKVVSSPLLRCHEFAQELAHANDIAVSVAHDIREIHFGEWEGLTTNEVHEVSPGLLEKVWQDSIAHTPPGGERLLDFAARVGDAWDTLLDEHAGEHVLVVAHGGTIRAILCHTLGIPLEGMWRFDVQYASMTRLRAWQSPQKPTVYSLLSHAAELSIYDD
ncbi:MAG: histidine phosphatase family protein [Pseudomonadota bacterium]